MVILSCASLRYLAAPFFAPRYPTVFKDVVPRDDDFEGGNGIETCLFF